MDGQNDTQIAAESTAHYNSVTRENRFDLHL